MVIRIKLADLAVISLSCCRSCRRIDLGFEYLNLITLFRTKLWLIVPRLEIAIWRMVDRVISLGSSFQNRVYSLDWFFPRVSV
jgi:hypothetical protein